MKGFVSIIDIRRHLRIILMVPFIKYSILSDNFYLIEKVNGSRYLYAWLDRHPDVYVGIFTSILKGGNCCYCYQVLKSTRSYD